LTALSIIYPIPDKPNFPCKSWNTNRTLVIYFRLVSLPNWEITYPTINIIEYIYNTLYTFIKFTTKMKNQIVVLAGILVLMATATIAASNIVQPAKAAYGNDVIKPNAQTGTWGSQVSSAAQDGTGHGIADWRANGNKIPGPNGQDYNNGQGTPNFGH
jgi:hypothetical protein